jgi:hypothetical protein
MKIIRCCGPELAEALSMHYGSNIEALSKQYVAFDKRRVTLFLILMFEDY